MKCECQRCDHNCLTAIGSVIYFVIMVMTVYRAFSSYDRVELLETRVTALEQQAR